MKEIILVFLLVFVFSTNVFAKCLCSNDTAVALKFDQPAVGWALAQQYGIKIHVCS